MAKKKQAHVGKSIAQSHSTGSERIIIASLLAYAAVRLSATFLFADGTRAWGIDYAGYLSGHWDIIVALSLPFVTSLPSMNRWAARLFNGDGKASGGASIAIACLASGIAVFLAWNFQVAFAFLGDGSYYATEIFRIVSNPDHAAAFIKPTSFLTGHLLRWTSLLLTPENVRTPFQILGVAGAGLLTAGAFLLTWKEQRVQTWLLFSAALLPAGALMFFGYIELYALCYVFVLLFFLSSFRAMRRGDSVLVPGVFLVLAVAFGASAIVFLPAYLLLLHWKVRGTGGSFPLKTAAWILSALPLAGVLVLYAWLGTATYNPYLLPISPAESVVEGVSQGVQSYTVFSADHLLDVVNVVLLNAGVLAVLLPVLVIVFRSSIEWKEPKMLFGVTAASASFILLLTGNTTLGLLRDWDLMTIPVAGLSFFAVSMFTHLHEKRKLNLALILPALLLTMAGGTYAWLRVNLDEPASAQRLDDAIERDKASLLSLNTYTGLENLRKYHRSLKDDATVLVLLKRMAETDFQKIDTYDKVQSMLATMKDATVREQVFAWLFDRYWKEYTEPPMKNTSAFIPEQVLRENLTKALLFGLQTGDERITQAALTRMKPVVPEWREARLLEAYLTHGITIDELAAQTRLAIDASTESPSLLIAAARIHDQAMQYERAAEYFELSLERDSKLYPTTYLELARIHVEKLGRIDEGVRVLRRCIEHTHGSDEAMEARRILAELERRR